MRRLFQAAVVLGLLAIAPLARAGIIVEGSVGKGAKLGPSPVAAEQSNFMLAPGITFADLLRVELGFVWDLPDLHASKHNFELRPMLVVAPPLLPIYGRAIFAFTNLASGHKDVAWGAAGGIKLGVGPIGVFAEVGLLPRSRAGTINWVVEGRLGAYVGF
jgi:hypothetical protein